MLVGVFVLAVLNNAMSLLGVGASTILFTNGVVLLAVVLADGQLARNGLAALGDARRRRLQNA